MINNCGPPIDDAIGLIDGASLAMECTSERTTQNAFDSENKCNTVVNNVFAYGPDGKVFITAINCPGSWVDGSLSPLFFYSVGKRIGPYKICGDQGFPHSDEMWNVWVVPMSKHSTKQLHSAGH